MTTLLIATTGGHLAQLWALRPRLAIEGDVLWVTHRNAQSEALLAGEQVEYVPYVRTRSIVDVVRRLPHAHSLLHGRRVTAAWSTGSGIAVGYLPYLAARGVACHYVESATRVSGPSLTGRLLQLAPRVHLYTQHPGWATGRWQFGGTVFDGYRSEPRPVEQSGALKVVVTMGTDEELDLRRIIEHLAAVLRPDGPLEQYCGASLEVLWQTGRTPVDGLGIEASPFVPFDRLSAALAAADLVISHAGVGSALAALDAGHVPVLVPRDPSRGEAVDDHQREIATLLAERGLAVSAPAEQVDVELLCSAMSRRITRSTASAAFSLR